MSSNLSRRLLADSVFLLALSAFLGCLHHALRADRPIFAAPRNPGYAALGAISASELHSLLGQPGVVLIDARPEKVYRQGTIPGSLSLPLHYAVEGGTLSILKSARRVIVFCSNMHCNASKEQGVALGTRGIERITIYEGGVEEWKRLGLPLGPGQR